MDYFYNPYHFIPVEKRLGQHQGDAKREDIGSGALTHDRYVDGTHSGRITCKLTTVTPTVLGGEQSKTKGVVGQVKTYERDGRPAVAASSLRGMAGSLVEAASNSAARILTPSIYSFRKAFDPKQTLSAIGVIADVNGELRLKPVALPTLEAASPGVFAVPARFRRIFPKPAFKTYIGDYRSIRSNGFPTRTSQNENQISKWTQRQIEYNAQGNIQDQPCLQCKPNPSNRKFLVAQLAEGNVPERDGLLRVLGCWGDRTNDIPEGKKHELWLPAPGPGVKAIQIDPLAIERFHSLADERTAASEKSGGPLMPFHPLDTRRNTDAIEFGKKFRLKAGDLVYFEVTDQSVVSEIALAAIWRGRVEDDNKQKAGSHEFFAAVDPDLLPFHAGRQRVTIAEQMLGFVEEDFKKQKEKKGGLAFASRIRFSDATLPAGVTSAEALEEREVTLKILSSPKPPSPAMYFKPASGPAAWIGKNQLKPGLHHPQGRKTYLHQFVKDGTQPWKTIDPAEHADQKNRVRPIRKGVSFEFAIEYDNLTPTELGLLLYALAPDAKFHHKLGMGKPLGLGSVKVEVLGIESINRIRRYSLAGLREDRSVPLGEFWHLRDAVINSGLVSPAIHHAICLLGDVTKAPPAGSVHTPTVEGQLPEKETFKWFVGNDGILVDPSGEIRKESKFLEPLPGRRDLPKLPVFTWRPSERRGRY